MTPTSQTLQDTVSLSPRQQEAAQRLDSAFFVADQRSNVHLQLRDGEGRAVELPDELVPLVMSVLAAAREGTTFSVGVLPKELTTSMAARMLGVSRPTVVKMIKDGELPARMVGTHRRVLTDDVQRVLAARLAKQRQVIAAMTDLADDVEDYS